MAESKEQGPRSLTQWDPFSDLDLFGDWNPFREFPSTSSRLRRFFQDRPEAAVFVPAVDVSEGDDEYTVTAEIPGVDRKDITVEVEDGVLTIRGEKKDEREEGGEKSKTRWVERSYGSFTRSLRLPRNVDVNRIEAKYKKAVLTITLAKTKESKPKVVSVKE